MATENTASSPEKRKNFTIFFIMLAWVFVVASIVVLLVLLFNSRLIENRQVAGKLVDFLICNNLTPFIMAEQAWFAKLHIGSICGIVVSGLVLVLLQLVQKKHGILLKIMAVIFSLAIIALNVFLSLNLILSDYISLAFSISDSGKPLHSQYQDSYASLQKGMQGSASAATLTLNKLIKDVESGYTNLDSLNDQDYINLALVASFLVDEQKGVLTQEQHYFRNMFARAPSTLDEMVDTIKNKPENPFGWELLHPNQSYLHMMGPDGEFNLKFVSRDGHFEAVYNKAGELLSESNNSLDMGTFNYASPLDSLEKHSNYDVSPYYKWGNVKGEPPAEQDLMQKMKDKFNQSTQAQQHYEEYRKKIEG